MSDHDLLDDDPVTSHLREIIQRYRVGAKNEDDMFWSSQPQHMYNEVRDIFQVDFSGERPINHVQFYAANFPHHITAEYWHPLRNEWVSLREQIGRITEIDPARNIADQREQWEGDPVSTSLHGSAPMVIRPNQGSIAGDEHPHHHGPGHWIKVKFRVVPVHTKGIRLIMVRHPNGSAPVTPDGSFTPYSLGVKEFQAGFRIYSTDDIPSHGRVTMQDFASSVDMLGSRVTYRLKEYKPEYVTDMVEGNHWKSDPQPVNYAVVNFYADTRDARGEPQTIDRFYIDPLTVGPSMNLYYTNDEPDANFAANDTPLHFPIAQVKGSDLDHTRNPINTNVEEIIFGGGGDTEAAFLDIDNAYLQWDHTRSWWLGLCGRYLREAPNTPLVTFAGNSLRLMGDFVEFVTAADNVYQIGRYRNPTPSPGGGGIDDDSSINPGLPSGEYSVIASYAPVGVQAPIIGDQNISRERAEEIVGGTAEVPTMTFAIKDESGITSYTTLHLKMGELGEERTETFSISRYPDETMPGFANLGLHAFVLKSDEDITPGVFSGFMQDPTIWVLKPDFARAPDLTSNALLRIHPSFATPDNPAGVVGGPGDRYDDVEWTPIGKDFILRQGFVRFPPTRAKHFKFEFTNLVHQHYNSLVPIRREVRLFPVDVVVASQESQPNRYVSGPRGFVDGVRRDLHDYTEVSPGTQTLMDLTADQMYESALEAMRRVSIENPSDYQSYTEGYVAADPATERNLSDTGWLWSWTPWHVGSSAPQWSLKQRHAYESIEVEHQTHTAFFVGIRRLEAYRVNYLTDDDTEIYIENFYDDEHIERLEGIEIQDGTLRTFSGGGLAESKTFHSTREVRGVQFATIQSEGNALLPDDGFVDEDLTANWRAYGDAILTRVPLEGVEVNRGWHQRSYGDIEEAFESYGDMDEMLYSDVEGSTLDGLAGGGIESVHIDTPAYGEITAAARVNALTDMAAPIRLEIVSHETGRVLAATERNLTNGESVIITASYGAGSVTHPNNYFFLENDYTYGEIEGLERPYNLYGTLEHNRVYDDVFVRLIQPLPSQDRFMVERLSLLRESAQWEFSSVGGGMGASGWSRSVKVRNNPYGVVIFDEPGTELKWRVRMDGGDSEVAALAIRPWYGGLLGEASRRGSDFSGPNRSVIDEYMDITDDPMWSQRVDPIPRWWYTRDVTSPHGRSPITEPPPQADPELIDTNYFTDPDSLSPLAWHPVYSGMQSAVSVDGLGIHQYAMRLTKRGGISDAYFINIGDLKPDTEYTAIATIRGEGGAFFSRVDYVSDIELDGTIPEGVDRVRVGGVWGESPDGNDLRYTFTTNSEEPHRPALIFSLAGVGGVVDVSGAMVYEGTHNRDFFSGASQDSILYRYVWAGRPNLSTSQMWLADPNFEALATNYYRNPRFVRVLPPEEYSGIERVQAINHAINPSAEADTGFAPVSFGSSQFMEFESPAYVGERAAWFTRRYDASVSPNYFARTDSLLGTNDPITPPSGATHVRAIYRAALIPPVSIGGSPTVIPEAQARVRLAWSDSAGSLFNTQFSPFVSEISSEGSWSVIDSGAIEMDPDDGASLIQIGGDIVSSDNSEVASLGVRAGMDAVQVYFGGPEIADLPQEFFLEGHPAPQGYSRALWTGDANESTTQLVIERPDRVTTSGTQSSLTSYFDGYYSYARVTATTNQTNAINIGFQCPEFPPVGSESNYTLEVRCTRDVDILVRCFDFDTENATAHHITAGDILTISGTSTVVNARKSITINEGQLQEGDIFDVRGAYFGDNPSEVFSGDDVDANFVYTAWAGPPNDSMSIKYEPGRGLHGFGDGEFVPPETD